MNVYQKIAQVMKEISYLTKDDKVDTGKGRSYKAISEEKVTGVVRQSLVKNGLVILPVKQARSRTDEQVTDQNGNVRINRISSVDVTYRIQNIDEPDDYVLVDSSGEGADTQDKGVGKAMTYSYKYMLLRSFAIPTGEDPDKISSDIYTETLTGKPTMEDLSKAKGITFQPEEESHALNCQKCGKIIKGIRHRNGSVQTAEEVAQMTGNLCVACARAEGLL